MDEKISQKEVEQYSEAYANRLADQFFNKKEKISGPEILSLCEIKQVNLFVVRELRHLWKLEIGKLKSHYFDYHSKEVKEALEQMQNVLSNQISIEKNDFLPLLKTAISRTINLILAPYDFYSDTVDRHGKGYIKAESLKDEVKYLKINQAPLEKLVLNLEEKNAELITGNEAFGMLDHILEEVNFTPEDIDPYISKFSQLLPLDLVNFYEQKAKTQEVKPVDVKRPEQATIFAEATKDTRTTLAENLAKQQSSQLKESLTINQKFMFTKILFRGDFEIFTDAIDYLDTLDSLPRVLAYLGDAYPEWNRESEEYEEFIEVLTKRFS